MLVTLTEILKIAQVQQNAIGAFNVPNMTTVKAVVNAAEELDVPVILMHTQMHEDTGVCKMEEIVPVMLSFAERSNVPVCVHLDHGESLDYVMRGLELGFTSVMYDGSLLSFEENVQNTKKIVAAAHEKGISVEAEIGTMGAREGGIGGGESVYTEPEAAVAFVEATGIDALACAFGTAHGLYTKTPVLDFERLKKIKELVNIPLVMHGGSGVSEDDYRKVIDIGIRKINYYTYMAKVGGMAVSKMQDMTFFHDIENVACSAMKENAKEALKVFSKKGEN